MGRYPLMRRDILDFYADYGIMTNPGRHAAALAALPTDIEQICEVIHGLVIHDGWVERYGIELRGGWLDEIRLRRMVRSIGSIIALNPAPLDIPRPPAQRLIGCCRDFTVLLCSILQSQGVPARARCGFEHYSAAGEYGDHWVAECWSRGEGTACNGRWVLVDAQLDGLQQEVWGIDFDVLDVPRGRFAVGGRAWEMCRAEGCDPERFGLLDARGLWFVRGNLIRDFAALNKVETVPFLVGRPWDSWELVSKSDAEISQGELMLLDRIAELSQHPDEAFDEVRRIYEDNPGLWPPGDQV